MIHQDISDTSHGYSVVGMNNIQKNNASKLLDERKKSYGIEEYND